MLVKWSEWREETFTAQLEMPYYSYVILRHIFVCRTSPYFSFFPTPVDAPTSMTRRIYWCSQFVELKLNLWIASFRLICAWSRLARSNLQTYHYALLNNTRAGYLCMLFASSARYLCIRWENVRSNGKKPPFLRVSIFICLLFPDTVYLLNGFM